MSPVTQYVYDGTKWQNEVTSERSTVSAAATTVFTLGTTKPTDANTGFDASLIDGTLTGDQNIKTAGTTISNKRILGYVLVNAANVTLDNCEIVGRDVGYVGATGLVQCNSTGTIINQCKIRPAYPRYFLNGISGGGFKAYRCHICNTCDGIAMKNNNSIAQGCYIHDLAFFDGKDTANGNGSEHASDSRFPGWTHNDGVQIYGFANNVVEGCNIMGYFSTTAGTYDTAMYDGCTGGNNKGRVYPSKNYAHGVFVSPTSAVLKNAVIKNNWIEGGEVCIQSSNQNNGHDTGNTVTITGNRFGCDQKPGYTGNSATDYTTISVISAIGTFTVTGNTYDTCASVPAAKRGADIGAGKDYSGMRKWVVFK
jgi:hypothetical protein